jgi:hypothetical protein
MEIGCRRLCHLVPAFSIGFIIPHNSEHLIERCFSRCSDFRVKLLRPLVADTWLRPESNLAPPRGIFDSLCFFF